MPWPDRKPAKTGYRIAALLWIASALAAGSSPQLTTDQRIDSLEHAIKSAPDDVRLKLALASAFIQKLRETGDAGYLKRASGVVDAVLSGDPGSTDAKRLRNEIEMNLHHFPKVVDYAEAMLMADPSDAPTLGLLGDAQMELGQYPEAGRAYKRMVSLGANLFSYNRLAYYEFVTGNAATALAWMGQAVAAGSKSPENLAWCYSELGDMLFKVGRLADAQVAYRSSFDTFSGYHRALAGLARMFTARGDLKSAIAYLVRAQAVVPLPEYAGALEILYEETGDKAKAAGQRDVLAVTEALMSASGEKANRTLAVIYADHGRNPPHALELAQAEFEVRNDVYSYDALSWVLYENNQLEAARAASAKALALGTPEPAFYFHAGMIELADGDRVNAKLHLDKALTLNPAFDIRHARQAVEALKQINAAR